MGFQKIYDLRGPWGLTAVFQLIYELRKNWRGRVDGTGREKSKVLQEVLADPKIIKGWGWHSWFYDMCSLFGVHLLFQCWYFIMETSSIHNLKLVVPFKALIGYFRPQQVLCSCCPQLRWCFPKMSNKQTLDVAHCSRDPSCGGPPDRCSQSTIPVTLLLSLTISGQFFSTSDWLIQE